MNRIALQGVFYHFISFALVSAGAIANFLRKRGFVTKVDLKKLKISTRTIRASAEASFQSVRSHIPPIFQTVNFDYKDAEEGLSIFKGEKSGYIYSRDSNPTTDLFAQIVALIEESEDAVSTASGMAAVSSVFSALTRPGDHIVSSSAIYGGTRAFLRDHLVLHGVKTSFVDITDENQIQQMIGKETKILYSEVVGNPNLVVADLQMLSRIAEQHQLILIVDSTFTPPPLIQPLKFGARIVIHSATKYMGGHGDLVGGVVAGDTSLIEQVRQSNKLYGGTMSPFHAWLAMRGLKTMALRLERQCRNAEKIAAFLDQHPAVSRVLYPGLPGHPQHAVAKKQLTAYGGIMAFDLGSGFQAAKQVMNAVRVCSFTTSLGEIDTLIIHPASTSHIRLSPEERQAIGISDSLMRLSVGIEDQDDLIDDLRQALDQTLE